MSQILLTLKNTKNEKILKQKLSDQVEIINGSEEIDSSWSVDAYILDSSTLKQNFHDLRQIKRKHEPVFVPAILLAAPSEQKLAQKALGNTVDDVLRTPVRSHVLRNRLQNLLRTRAMSRELKKLNTQLEKKVRQRTQTIRKREKEIVNHLVTAAHHRDEETGNHIRRLGIYTTVLADELGWDPSRSDDLGLAASLHDIGKIGIPDDILHKPADLTEEEFEIIKQHAELGAQILEETNVDILELARKVALTHHECWDGSGYPKGLAGEEIPESGRITAVVDVYDALTNKRVYRDPMPEEKALKIIREGRGSDFEPRIVDAFFAIQETLEKKAEPFRERK